MGAGRIARRLDSAHETALDSRARRRCAARGRHAGACAGPRPLRSNLDRLMKSSTVRGMRVRPHAKSTSAWRLRGDRWPPARSGSAARRFRGRSVLAGASTTCWSATRSSASARSPPSRRWPCAIRRPSSASASMTLSRCASWPPRAVPGRRTRGLHRTRCRSRSRRRARHGGSRRPRREIKLHKGLKLRGLQAYYGSAQHRPLGAGAAAGNHAGGRLGRRGARRLLAEGSPVHRHRGGTGTFPYETGSGVYNEVQPGSYVLMDVDYGKNEFDPIARPSNRRCTSFRRS